MDSVLVVHIGAGRYPVNQSQKYKKLLKSALRAGNLVEASRIIERSPLTNTGYGSSVDRKGETTADACLIEVSGRRIVNSLAIQNIYNDVYPTAVVDVALRQLEKEFSPGSVNRQFGLSKPVSLGYEYYMDHLDKNSDIINECKHNSTVAGKQPTNLVSKKGRESYETFKVMFDAEGEKMDQSKRPSVSSSNSESNTESSKSESSNAKGQCTSAQILPVKEENSRKHPSLDTLSEAQNTKKHKTTTDKDTTICSLTAVEDTVGYIELSPSITQLATSSGGNFFRVPGRISCAGITGSGIAYSCHKDIEISCMCSGNGDDIITMNLASYLSETIAETLAESEEWPELGPLLVSRILRKSNQVVKTAVNANLQEITYVGVIMVVKTPSSTRLVFCHSTESFYFAFRSQGILETVLSRTDCPIGEFLHGEYKL